MRRLLATAVLLIGASAMLMGQTTYTVKTFAGIVSPTFSTVNTLLLTNPSGVVEDTSGTFYFSDTANHRVYKADSTGAASIVIGTNAPGTPSDGKAANTQPIDSPWGLALDSAGNLYVAGKGNSQIYKIDTTGIVTKFAGGANGRYSGDGRVATKAEINGPRQIGFYKGDLYIADAGNNRIRKVSNGIMSTVAGGGNPPSPSLGDGLRATLAKLSGPEGFGFDSKGNLFIADTGNNRIRMVDTNGIMSTVAGRDLTNTEKALDSSGNPIKRPVDSVAPPRNLGAAAPPYATRCTNIRNGIPVNISSGVTTSVCAIVGDGTDPLNALLASPSAIVVDADNTVIFADKANNRIRKLQNGIISTVVGTGSSGSGGDGGLGSNATLNSPTGLFLDASNVLLITDAGSNQVRALAQGLVQSITSANTFNGDTTALASLFFQPSAVAVDAAGNVFVADTGNGRIRKIDASGAVTTVAGGGSDSSTEGIAATSARVNQPTGLAVDPSGSVIYYSEAGASRIRKIVAGNVTTVVGGGSNPITSSPAPGTSVGLSLGISSSDNKTRRRAALALDGAGNLYFTDPGDHVVGMLTPDGNVVAIAGSYGTSGAAGDGGPPVATGTNPATALLNLPSGLAVTKDGKTIFISDMNNHAVRAVSGGVILIIAGEEGSAGNDNSTSNPSFNQRLRKPLGITLSADEATLYIVNAANNSVRAVNLSALTQRVIAGTRDGDDGDFVTRFTGDNVAATSAQFSYPSGIALGPDGKLYVTDTANNVVRVLIPDAAK